MLKIKFPLGFPRFLLRISSRILISETAANQTLVGLIRCPFSKVYLHTRLFLRPYRASKAFWVVFRPVVFDFQARGPQTLCPPLVRTCRAMLRGHSMVHICWSSLPACRMSDLT